MGILKTLNTLENLKIARTEMQALLDTAYEAETYTELLKIEIKAANLETDLHPYDKELIYGFFHGEHDDGIECSTIRDEITEMYQKIAKLHMKALEREIKNME